MENNITKVYDAVVFSYGEGSAIYRLHGNSKDRIVVKVLHEGNKVPIRYAVPLSVFKKLLEEHPEWAEGS